MINKLITLCFGFVLYIHVPKNSVRVKSGFVKPIAAEAWQGCSDKRFVLWQLIQSCGSVSSALVGLLDGLLQSGASSAQRKKIEIGEHKRKRMKSDTDTTRFSSASMRSQLDHATNLKGEQVAAKVKSDEEKDEWVVVKVIHFDKETKEYEVFDEEPGDDEESAQKLLVALLPAAVVSQWMAMSGKGSVCVRLLICLARSDVTTTLVSGVSLWSMQMVGSMCT